MLLKYSVSVLILKYATPLDPRFILSVTLEESFKNDMNIKNTLESRKQETKVWLHYCELKVKSLSHQADFSTRITNKVMSVEQVVTSGNRFKHDCYIKKLSVNSSVCIVFVCVCRFYTHTRVHVCAHTHAIYKPGKKHLCQCLPGV